VTFAVPVTVTFGWTDNDTPGVVDGTSVPERNLYVYRNGWIPLPLTYICRDQLCTAQACCDQIANTWTVQRTEFSEYAVAPCQAIERAV
jgi:hypothetical protein